MIVDNFDKAEWALDVRRMREIAPNIRWRVTEEMMDYSKLSLFDFEYAVQ